jgi:hypothetical protein
MSAQYRRVGVTADLTIEVNRPTDGTLVDGARATVERGDRVTVDTLEVTGVTPRLNDVTVDATVEATVALDEDETVTAVRERLAAGFGVTVESVDGPDA